MGFWNWLCKNKKPVNRSSGYTPESDQEFMVRTFFDEGKMPCCGSMLYLIGPSGGLMTNIQCPGCKMKFNVSPHNFKIIERI